MGQQGVEEDLDGRVAGVGPGVEGQLAEAGQQREPEVQALAVAVVAAGPLVEGACRPPLLPPGLGDAAGSARRPA